MKRGKQDVAFYHNRSRGLRPLSTQIELSFPASGLANLGIASESNLMLVVYAKKSDGKRGEVGRTEVIQNSSNPQWKRKVPVVYQFEMEQPLTFHVYGVTKCPNESESEERLNLRDERQKFLGEGSCVLSEIVTKPTCSLTLNLNNKKVHGGSSNLATLTVHAKEPSASRRTVEIEFRCSKFKEKIDRFLKIFRKDDTGDSVLICATEVVKNNLNPVWKPLCLSMQQFRSKDTQLDIECFAFNSNGNHDLIGKLQKSVADLEKQNLSKKKGAKFVSSHHGHETVQLFVDKFCEKEQKDTFLYYIGRGYELKFMVAVDFTESNGDPRKYDSLHYIDPHKQLNSYQQAITEVGEVFQSYNTDNRIHAWGFGGRVENETSDCFNLSAESEVEGVEGIMAAYASSLRKVALQGPTKFGRVIDTAAEIARTSSASSNKKYHVLLIITDGEVSNIKETKEALERASNVPLSILIVGVGDADFKQMEMLDADNVHFVPMKKVHGGQISLVQALLGELPGQFLSFMRSKGKEKQEPI